MKEVMDCQKWVRSRNVIAVILGCGLILTGTHFDRWNGTGPKPGSRNLSKKNDVFFIFFRFKKENLAWWWFQSIFHRNVIQRNLLGHSFCCFFMGMLDVYICWTKTWSTGFFTVLKINDLYILPPLFGESFEVKHILGKNSKYYFHPCSIQFS